MEQQEYINKISYFADEYRNVFLTRKYDPDSLCSDWWEALMFFLARAYYQGRRDTLSIKVHQAALGTINKLFSESDKYKVYQEMMSDNWKTLTNELGSVIGKGKVGKSADIKLTIDAFKFIKTLPSMNIVAYSVGQIKSRKPREHYTQLQRSKTKNGIYSVGPKIASFYLRDVVSLYELDKYVAADELTILQPVDTWVRRISHKIGIIDSSKEKDIVVRQKIVDACKLSQVSSLKFNQGAWYMGYHSFELVLRNLDVIT